MVRAAMQGKNHRQASSVLISWPVAYKIQHGMVSLEHQVYPIFILG
jgi:hypothetical protein